MIVSPESILKMTVSQIKQHNNGYFFSRKTMKFFGDTMKSFGVRTFEGKRVLYRKPNAMVNVFGTWKRTGKEFFNCWIVEYVSNSEIKLKSPDSELTEKFYNSL